MTELEWIETYRKNPLTGLCAEARLLEEKYGKCVYTPLDIEPIRPASASDFIAWFNENALPIKRKKADIASGVNAAAPPQFLSINGRLSPTNETWEQNIRNEFYEVFPEVRALAEQLPLSSTASWNLWSSIGPIHPHRDSFYLLDIPCSMRVMLMTRTRSQRLA